VITSNGKVLEYHGQKYCVTCKQITDHTCFHVAYRKSESSDDAYRKEERWNCDRCHTDKVIVKEIPIPTEKTMLVKLLMSLSEKYELQGTAISVSYREVRAVFRFPEDDLRKLREIAENWAERGYINAKHLLMLEKAGMADVAKIPPRWAPSKREARIETRRSVFEE
jgi:ribosomal protein L44E